MNSFTDSIWRFWNLWSTCEIHVFGGKIFAKMYVKKFDSCLMNKHWLMESNFSTPRLPYRYSLYPYIEISLQLTVFNESFQNTWQRYIFSTPLQGSFNKFWTVTLYTLWCNGTGTKVDKIINAYLTIMSHNKLTIQKVWYLVFQSVFNFLFLHLCLAPKI